MQRPAHILVFRFSALGDIAMTVPVLKCLLQQHSLLRVTVVSVPWVQPLFADIDRLQFYAADVKNDYKGMRGLYRLAKKLKKDIAFDAIADLHNVLRTKLLRFFLRSVPAAVIDKGRAEKESLTRQHNKELRQLKTTFQRYAAVFAGLHHPVQLVAAEGIKRKSLTDGLLPNEGGRVIKIGIAPFARHTAKMYPLEKMEQVVSRLSSYSSVQVVLLGSKEEAVVLDEWANRYGGVLSAAGKFSLAEELAIISRLNILISMDSANMHLASLYGVTVVSLWGGTHPFLGFYGWGQLYGNALQADLPCRPSSVFGNKDCPVHGKAGCMQPIAPEHVVEKVVSLLPAGTV